MSDKIQLSGIFEQGYGIVPKKLMRMSLDNKIGKQRGRNVKLVLCYLLSYSGSGVSAFPSINTISRDLEVSKPVVIEALKNANELNLITIEKHKNEKGLYQNNIYQLDFMIPNHECIEKTSDGSEFFVKSYGGSKENIPGVVNYVDQGSKECLPGVVNRINTNNNNIIITNNNRGKKKNFIRPTLKEIEEYCKEMKYTFDIEQLYDYYESKGWMVGKNKMKDWKAAVRNWNRRQGEFSGNSDDTLTLEEIKKRYG